MEISGRGLPKVDDYRSVRGLVGMWRGRQNFVEHNERERSLPGIGKRTLLDYVPALFSAMQRRWRPEAGSRVAGWSGKNRSGAAAEKVRRWSRSRHRSHGGAPYFFPRFAQGLGSTYAFDQHYQPGSYVRIRLTAIRLANCYDHFTIAIANERAT